MDLYTTVLSGVVYALHIFSILILIWGATSAGISFFKVRFKKGLKVNTTKQNTAIKIEMGSYVLLSLEILIAADIIDSILKPTFEDILRLGAIVLIRTVISFFLSKEIQEANKVTDEKPPL